jgi:hypothetical protein
VSERDHQISASRAYGCDSRARPMRASLCHAVRSMPEVVRSPGLAGQESPEAACAARMRM